MGNDAPTIRVNSAGVVCSIEQVSAQVEKNSGEDAVPLRTAGSPHPTKIRQPYL